MMQEITVTFRSGYLNETDEGGFYDFFHWMVTKDRERPSPGAIKAMSADLFVQSVSIKEVASEEA